ncbi:hypothetical protein RhiirA4_213090 [Rhizophagus irregularis]|uniref:Uncharacterized protein n=1 Tax=Rhizophagus irregularis TaxID=588596 RepID=A0A2I1GM16_9GLOM|nr:hypothetical protein RhiirA4_213090 [Rhizophagus irregularis]
MKKITINILLYLFFFCSPNKLSVVVEAIVSNLSYNYPNNKSYRNHSSISFIRGLFEKKILS